MARKNSIARAASATPRRKDGTVPFVLVRPSDDATDALERMLTDFDAEADLAAIIPMPDAIPAVIRATITKAMAQRFTFADELDAWLHEPHDTLGGDTPFERIVDGDGIPVLMALLEGGDEAGIVALLEDLERSAAPLRLVR